MLPNLLMKYQTDAPLVIESEDKFSRYPFAERIGSVIAERKDPSCIVVGLYGAWGEGKTSVLNFVTCSLESNPNVICVKFNPWRFGNEDELLLGFFNIIAHALDVKLVTRGEQSKKVFADLLPALTSIVGSDEAGKFVRSFINIPGLEDFREKVEYELRKHQKRVLILVDDIDRLDKEEIYALFRLVKLTANFEYLAYIMAFDPDIVSAALQERYGLASESSGQLFLEKIIQVPLQLPHVSNEKLRDMCFAGVEEALRLASVQVTENQLGRFASIFDETFTASLDTPRKAKIYSNSLSFVLPILIGEVNPVDLMLIEAVKVFFPELYKFIRDNQTLFEGYFQNNVSYKNSNHERLKTKQNIDQHLANYSEGKRTRMIALLRVLFPKLNEIYSNHRIGSHNSNDWFKKQRICSPRYCARYFSLSIADSDVSDIEIHQLLVNRSTWIDSTNAVLHLRGILNFENASAVIQKLKNKIHILDPSHAKSLGIAIAQNSNQFDDKGLMFGWFSVEDRACKLIVELAQMMPVNERFDFINLCIESAESFNFKKAIFYSIQSEDNETLDYDLLDEHITTKIGSKLVKLIEEYVDQNINEPMALFTFTNNLDYRTQELIKDYGAKDFINNYVQSNLLGRPSIILKILWVLSPASYSLTFRRRHIGRIDKDSYLRICEFIDPEIILNFSKTLPVLPKIDHDKILTGEKDEDEYILLAKFIKIHHKVLGQLK